MCAILDEKPDLCLDFSDDSRARKLMHFEQNENRENPISRLNIILLLSISEHCLLRPRKNCVGVTSWYLAERPWQESMEMTIFHVMPFYHNEISVCCGCRECLFWSVEQDPTRV